MKTIENIIKELAERLLHEDVRKNPEILDELLAEEFEEVGASGELISREVVIDFLVKKENNIQWSLDNIRVTEIVSGVVLSLYEAKKKNIKENKSKGSMRSSIWKLCGDQWKMVFHQGTQIDGNHDI